MSAAESTDPAGSALGSGRRLLLWSAVGGGAVAVGVGGYLLAIDGRGTCEADRGQECPQTYDTGTGGLVTIGVGTATMGVAAYFLWRGRKKDAAGPPGWSLRLGPGRGIALSGSF